MVEQPLRERRKQDERRILWMVLGTLVLVGTLLIGLFIGPAAMITALPVLLLGAGTIWGLWTLFNMLECWLESR